MSANQTSFTKELYKGGDERALSSQDYTLANLSYSAHTTFSHTNTVCHHFFDAATDHEAENESFKCFSGTSVWFARINCLSSSVRLN